METIGTIGTIYYCPIDNKTYKITGEHTAVEDNDPQDIQDAKDVRISNWRDFHVEGQTGPAGDPGNTYSGGGNSKNGPPGLGKVNLSNNGGPVPGNIQSWVDQAAKELEKKGIHLSAQDKLNLAIIALHESGGNPYAINLTDGNAAAGHPSKGLMQTIESTFNTYKLPGHDNILNPVDNIIAAYRYMIATYGSTGNVPGIVSLNNGGQYKGY